MSPSPRGGNSRWLHEIKHDGFRVTARKDGARVRLYSCPGNDFTHWFSLIVEALARLRVALRMIEWINGRVICAWSAV